MSKNRPVRVGDEMRRLLADLIRNEVKDPRIPLLTSVTDVEVTGDLSHATVFVSVMGTDKEQSDSLAALKGASGFFRSEIARRMRIRVTPELSFKLDSSIQQGIKMSRLIDEAMGRGRSNNTENDADEDNGDDTEV